MANKIMDLSDLEQVLPEGGFSQPCGRGCEGSEVSRLQDHLVSPTFPKEQIPDESSGGMQLC